VTKNMTWTKPTKPLTAAFVMLAIVAPMIALVPSARAAGPTCDEFKSRLVGAAQALQQAGLSPPVIRYVQRPDMGPLKAFEIPFAESNKSADLSNLYCRDGRFDSFDVLFMPTNDIHAVLRFRYLMTAAIMAFTEWEAGAALKSVDKLVTDVNANTDASIELTSHAVIHLYGVDRNSQYAAIDHINFQLNAADAFDGPSPGKE